MTEERETPLSKAVSELILAMTHPDSTPEIVAMAYRHLQRAERALGFGYGSDKAQLK